MAARRTSGLGADEVTDFEPEIVALLGTLRGVVESALVVVGPVASTRRRAALSGSRVNIAGMGVPVKVVRQSFQDEERAQRVLHHVYVPAHSGVVRGTPLPLGERQRVFPIYVHVALARPRGTSSWLRRRAGGVLSPEQVEAVHDQARRSTTSRG